MKLIPKNWKEFQHYKHRSPPWIKLHKKFLDDYEFQCLPVASRALAPMLWLLASETDDGVIDGSQEKLAFRIRMTEKDFSDALNPLINMGFFDCESAAQAPCKQDAKTEKSRDRVELETEKRQITCQAANASDDIQEAYDYYNLIAKQFGLTKAIKLNDQRKKLLRCRLDEYGLDTWKEAMDKVGSCPHLMGHNDRNWKADLPFFLQKSKFLKHLEGSYEQSNNNTADHERDRRRKAIAATLAN